MAHPIHPAIVHFPIACWTLSTLGDIASFWLGEPAWRISGVLLIIGTLSAIGAMITGLLDLRTIKSSGEAARIADVHLQLILAAWMLYASSLLLRLMDQRLSAPGLMGICLSILGFAVLGVAGWYGGKLVYEHGVGIGRQ